MSSANIFVVFFVSHMTGDYLVQTDWQAQNKAGGLGRDSTSRRALLTHVLTYTLAFVPALIWLGSDLGPFALAGIAAAISVPHLIVDDGRLLLAYVEKIKGAPTPSPDLLASVDQAVHLICLYGAALLAASA